MKNEPNKITATLKVVITGEFYDDEASEETLRYCVEQDLEDAGFDVDVELLKEQPEIVRCRDCKYMYRLPWLDDEAFKAMVCNKHNYTGMRKEDFFCADGERRDDNG